jgi:hypothetical protein
MSAPPQIKQNAQWVIQNFGPESGLAKFGYDADSVGYLDTFIERQGASFRSSEQSTNKIVSLLGAFLGEAIIATYGGAWNQTADGLALEIKSGSQHHILQPFDKVHKRLINGPADSLHYYFATFLPQVLGASEGTRKPWWKPF